MGSGEMIGGERALLVGSRGRPGSTTTSAMRHSHSPLSEPRSSPEAWHRTAWPRCGRRPGRLERDAWFWGDAWHACSDDWGGLCGPGLGGVLCGFRARGVLRRQGRGPDRGLAGGADADVRAGAVRISWPRTCAPGGCPLPASWRRRWRAADAVFIAVGTPSRRGDGHADLSFVYQAAREIAAALVRLHGGGDQVDGAGGHRRRGRAHHPRDRPEARFRGRVEPGIPARGGGDRRLQAPRPDRHRHRGRARQGGDDRALPAARTSTRRRSCSRRGARRN